MSGRALKAAALRLRGRLVPESRGYGWGPFLWLGYLAFPLLPVLAGWLDTFGVVLTLGLIPPFLWLYFLGFRLGQRWAVFAVAMVIAGFGYLLTPFNPFGNAYLIYAAAFLPVAMSLHKALAVYLLLAGVYAAQAYTQGLHWLSPAIALLIGVSVCVSNHYMLQKTRKDAELRLSLDEVKRLAQVAERERIGRDLHDLLGHTLSLIALKSELARKLIERDPLAARVEIAEVERVARDALAQVRRAVTGIRSAALKPELASARLLLDGEGIGLTYSLADLPLLPMQETALALVVREAITNVHRHAQARQVEISLRGDGGYAVLTVIDDGRGGAGEHGNGLRGMAERIRALGGTLHVQSPAGQGTRVVASVPLRAGEGDRSDNVTPLHRSAA